MDHFVPYPKQQRSSRSAGPCSCSASCFWVHATSTTSAVASRRCRRHCCPSACRRWRGPGWSRASPAVKGIGSTTRPRPLKNSGPSSKQWAIGVRGGPAAGSYPTSSMPAGSCGTCAGRLSLVLYIEIIDARLSRWWFVVRDGEVDLCWDDPGFDVDITLYASLLTLVKIFIGDLPRARARELGKVEIYGPKNLIRGMSTWFPRSKYADDKPLPVA